MDVFMTNKNTITGMAFLISGLISGRLSYPNLAMMLLKVALGRMALSSNSRLAK